MSDAAQAETQAGGMPTASEHHRLLKPFVGKFRSEVKIFMGPGEPMVSTGTMTNTMELNDLYLQQDYVGDANDGPFPSFLGKGFWGFNPTTHQYEGFWIDNASSIMQTESGTVDSGGKTWEMRGTIATPETFPPTQRRTKIVLVDDDHHTMESYFIDPSGREFKSMEIRYERIA